MLLRMGALPYPSNGVTTKTASSWRPDPNGCKLHEELDTRRLNARG
jgi:hypothetical protein